MNDLIKQGNTGLQLYSEIDVLNNIQITNKQKEIFLSSRNFERISEIKDKNKVVKTIHQYINHTILDKGINISSPEELDYIKRRVVDDVLADYSHYTLEEVKLAFKYGVRGDLGEYYGINPTTFYSWLRDFKFKLLSDVNKAVLPLIEKTKKIQSKPKPSEKEVDFEIANTLIEFYNEYLIDDEYNYLDIGNITYALLKKLGFISVNEEYKKELVERSKIYLKNDALSNKRKNKYSINIEQVFKKIDTNEKDYLSKIISEAKRLALKDFIKAQKQMKSDFKSELLKKLNEFHDEK